MSDGVERQWLTYGTPHVDLRDFIDRADKAGELVHAKGVHWDLEMGALADPTCVAIEPGTREFP